MQDPTSADAFRAVRTERFLSLASSIVDSDTCLRTYAACEWSELDENGQLWIAAIVREAFARAASGAQPAPDPVKMIEAGPIMLTQGGFRPL